MIVFSCINEKKDKARHIFLIGKKKKKGYMFIAMAASMLQLAADIICEEEGLNNEDAKNIVIEIISNKDLKKK